MSIDYLTEDKLLPDNQKFVCISFLTNTKDTTLIGIKIRGVFTTYEEACIFAKKLQTIDPSFNVFVGDMGKWLSFDPNPDSIKNNEYENEKLNSMMKSYMDNQEKAKVFHEQRKNEMVRDNLINNMTTQTDTIKELKEQLLKADKDEVKTIETNIQTIEDKINKTLKKKQDVEAQLELIAKQLRN